MADQGFAFNFSLNMGSTISFSLEAKDKSLASDSPGKTKKKASPSTLGRNARHKEAFLKKKRQNPVPDPVSTEGGVEPGVGPWDCQSREKTLPSVTFVETVSNLKLV